MCHIWPMKPWRLCCETDNVLGTTRTCFVHLLWDFSGFAARKSFSFGREEDEKKFNQNKFGRSYCPGVALDQDLKCSIIDRIISKGGDQFTGYIPRSFTQFANELRDLKWYRYWDKMQTLAKPKEACHLKNYRKVTLNSSKYWKSTPHLSPFPKSSRS